MCGIYGVIEGRLRPEDLQTLRCSLHHRGPDAVGEFNAANGFIGQNRLAIIDVEHGDPPITNEGATIGGVLNGEIYNFREIRKDLQRRHRFTTGCDTEVLVHLAEELDPVGVARRLDGMFAFAYTDSGIKRLVLGRDRAGKKPLYYWSNGDSFAFASEIKALFSSGMVPRDLDESAIPAYLMFGYVPTPRTIFRGVRSVPPGHVLTWSPGSPPVIECYWRLRVPKHTPRTPTRILAIELREHLRHAIRKRLVSDVPLGAFLSGGTDSSAIVAIMAGETPDPVPTFTIGFDDRHGFDERPYASLVARRYRTDHHELVVRPDAVQLVDKLVWHYDQPFGDSSALPTLLLSELTREHVTVALCGDGGDELFAGYERFTAGVAAKRLSVLPRPVLGLLRRAASVGGSGAHGSGDGVSRLKQFGAALDDDSLTTYRSWLSFLSDDLRCELMGSADLGWANADFRSIYDEYAGASELNRLLALNFRTYLVDDLLVKVDRMSMAHGLEVRSPFLDTALTDFAFGLPSRQKAYGLGLKRLLKVAMRDHIPHEILNRRKHGFGIPIDRWFREDLRAYAEASLGPASSLRKHVDGAVLDRLLAEQRAGASHGHALWTMLTLEIFMQAQGW